MVLLWLSLISLVLGHDASLSDAKCGLSCSKGRDLSFPATSIGAKVTGVEILVVTVAGTGAIKYDLTYHPRSIAPPQKNEILFNFPNKLLQKH